MDEGHKAARGRVGVPHDVGVAREGSVGPLHRQLDVSLELVPRVELEARAADLLVQPTASLILPGVYDGGLARHTSGERRRDTRGTSGGEGQPGGKLGVLEGAVPQARGAGGDVGGDGARVRCGGGVGARRGRVRRGGWGGGGITDAVLGAGLDAHVDGGSAAGHGVGDDCARAGAAGVEGSVIGDFNVRDRLLLDHAQAELVLGGGAHLEGQVGERHVGGVGRVVDPVVDEAQRRGGLDRFSAAGPGPKAVEAHVLHGGAGRARRHGVGVEPDARHGLGLGRDAQLWGALNVVGVRLVEGGVPVDVSALDDDLVRPEHVDTVAVVGHDAAIDGDALGSLDVDTLAAVLERSGAGEGLGGVGLVPHDLQSVEAVRVGDVVSESDDGGLVGEGDGVISVAHNVQALAEVEAHHLRTRGDIAGPRIAGRRGPEHRNLRVVFVVQLAVEGSTGGEEGHGADVPVEDIANLRALLEGVAVAFVVVRNVLADVQVVRALDLDATVLGVGDGVFLHGRCGGIAHEAEVDGIAAELPRLPEPVDGHALDLLRGVGRQHREGPPVPGEFDIAAEEHNLTAEVGGFARGEGGTEAVRLVHVHDAPGLDGRYRNFLNLIHPDFVRGNDGPGARAIALISHGRVDSHAPRRGAALELERHIVKVEVGTDAPLDSEQQIDDIGVHGVGVLRGPGDLS
mmetsp:Transcript_51215/g.153862  ORF Transcript_51215/g.153862 Transcript_51215/m.153862 type:complete len:685 (-) Transcript_51215:1855-3909(-)